VIDRDSPEAARDTPTAAVDHGQATGLGGVALGVVGTALLFASQGDPTIALFAGYALGAGTVLIALEVFKA